MNEKMNVKDLINVGIFAAIYFVLFFMSAMTGFVPIFAVAFPGILALISGIPITLYIIKVRKFGMMTLLGLVMGLLVFLIGQGWMAVITGLICGLVADMILKTEGAPEWKNVLMAYSVFSLWVIGSMLPMWIMKDAFFASVSTGQGAEYANAVMGYITGGTLVGIVVLTMVCAVIGAYVGRKMLKKHFQRAGIV